MYPAAPRFIGLLQSYRFVESSASCVVNFHDCDKIDYLEQSVCICYDTLTSSKVDRAKMNIQVIGNL